MTLPRPGATASVTLAGGASQVTLGLPAGVPARLRLDGGAASATLAGQTYTGLAGGTVLAAPGWGRAASRYDIDAPAGVSAISVAGWRRPAQHRPGGPQPVISAGGGVPQARRG